MKQQGVDFRGGKTGATMPQSNHTNQYQQSKTLECFNKYLLYNAFH